jgi:hypothetical protein
VTQIRPYAIFAAHDHKSLHVSADTETGEERLAEMLPPGGGPIWKYQLNAGLVHEFVVPTCSYRMGATDMGYGAAVIGKCAIEITYLPKPKSVYEPCEYQCCYFSMS